MDRGGGDGGTGIRGAEAGVEWGEAGIDRGEAGVERAWSGDRGAEYGAGSLERLGGKLIFYRKFKEKGP